MNYTVLIFSTILGLFLINLLFIIIGIISMKYNTVYVNTSFSKRIIPYYKSYYYLYKYRTNLCIKYYSKVTVGNNNATQDFIFDRDMQIRLDDKKFYLILDNSIVEYDYNYNETDRMFTPIIGGFIFLLIKDRPKKCSNIVHLKEELTDDIFRDIIFSNRRDQKLRKIL